jgi:hypothetical protein
MDWGAEGDLCHETASITSPSSYYALPFVHPEGSQMAPLELGSQIHCRRVNQSGRRAAGRYFRAHLEVRFLSHPAAISRVDGVLHVALSAKLSGTDA